MSAAWKWFRRCPLVARTVYRRWETPRRRRKPCRSRLTSSARSTGRMLWDLDRGRVDLLLAEALVSRRTAAPLKYDPPAGVGIEAVFMSALAEDLYALL